MTVAAIVGSAFSTGAEGPAQLSLQAESITTEHGSVELHRVRGADAYLVFRHGLPHRALPNQINYRGYAAALQSVGVKALLITSSVGVLDAQTPLFEPLLVEDLLMVDNRLPDGSSCTMFASRSKEQGHLVLEEGLFHRALDQQVEALNGAALPRVIFGYAQGPRTKTPAENRMFKTLGAQVNSMSLAPEVVLANELEIPCAAVVVGHKYSLGADSAPKDDQDAIARSLVLSKQKLESLVIRFLEHAQPVEFKNHLYRFGE